ncbi:MAG: DegV family protein [Clostridia bacterium]|nr:DegV family protein [Clostridia bacterium]MDQ7790639.1 DegV family protein [Clostridia bacterium]
MPNVRIVTDSTADLPPDLVSKYGITVVPLKVLFEQDVYRDGVDISLDDFYRRLVDQPSSTSQPSPAEFLEVYQSFSEQGDSIVSIHISAALSGTHQSAQLAKSMMPKADIELIDSKVTSVGLGLIVLAAAKSVQEGWNKHEVIHFVNWLVDNIRVYFMVNTLDYLQRGGRIGRAHAFLGTLLNIKPLLKLSDGLVTPHEKVRGRTKCLDRIAEIGKELSEQRGQLVYATLHGNAPKLGQELDERLFSRLGYEPEYRTRAGAVIGTHTGPGVVGVAYHPVYHK